MWGWGNLGMSSWPADQLQTLFSVCDYEAFELDVYPDTGYLFIHGEGQTSNFDATVLPTTDNTHWIQLDTTELALDAYSYQCI